MLSTNSHSLLLVIGVVISLVSCEDLYCGDLNCYDTLGIARNASMAQVKKAFYKKSLK